MSDMINYNKFLPYLRQSKSALVLGPSLVTGLDKYGKERPLMDLCAYEISKELTEDFPSLSEEQRYDLFHVANLYKNKYKNSNSTLERDIALFDFYNKQSYINQTLKVLAELPFKIIINTTPDCLFTKALNGRAHKFDYYHFKRPAPISFDPKATEPLVYNLFGWYGETTSDGLINNCADSLPLTGTDQIEYIKKVTAEETKALITLRQAFKDYRFFFLGFDFSSWYARLLMSVLNISNSSALEARVEPDNPVGIFFRNEFLIDFLPIGIHEFSQKLNHAYKESTGEITSRPALVAQKEVLLLHIDGDQEDQKRLQRLTQALHAIEGIACWDVTQVLPGETPAQVVVNKIKSSRCIILMLSASTISNEFFAYTILPEVRKRKQEGCVVLPLVMSSCAWEANPLLKELREFIRPRGTAIDLTPNQDAALKDFALEVRETLERINYSVPS